MGIDFSRNLSCIDLRLLSDISESKSAWFGESEKRIKAIFTEYKSLVKICERIPILLFNEADAIISKRKEIFFSSVAQTENAMQNILLDELENFEGIFIATTNLIKNLDSAFDRRFLFKIEFSNPDVTTKARIWKLKMPDLSEDDCLALASRFNFSGGQIDNIARKYEIHGLLNGVKMNFQEIINYCNTEILVKSNTVKIGYKTA
jgi:SpoVK/Ycf46/Vps4 family AAA+-type ATPase